MRGGRIAVFALAAIAAVPGSTSLSAHRRDEYLQAARLAVEPGRVELHLDLTPGIEVSDAIVGDIDRNHDGALSATETRAYVSRVFDALELRNDGRSVHLEPVASTFPDADAFRRGEGTIRLRSAARLPRTSGGEHQLVFRNRHRPDVSVYLANALVPDGDSIAIVAQRRDTAQRDLAIEYVVRNQRGSMAAWLLGIAGASLLAALSRAKLSCSRPPRARRMVGVAQG